MKTTYSLRASVVLALLAVFLNAHAQQPAAPGGAVDWTKQIRIKKIVGTGRQTVVKTPSYNTNASRSATPEKDWYQFWVNYETAPEWIDEMVFSFHVLAKTTVKGKDAFSLYRKTVRYIDVAKGRSHMSTVYLRPNAIKRYGEVVAVAVEISVKGQPAAENFEVKIPNMPDKWWKNPAVVESAAVTVRDGYLLDRSETPFAFINVDDYEVIK